MARKTSLKIGDTMADGTIYAGVSPDTGEHMYAAPSDTPARMIFNDAAEDVRKFRLGGKKDFRLPSKNELNVLFKNRNKGSLSGTFNESGKNSYDVHYFSSSNYNEEPDELVWYQNFSNGHQDAACVGDDCIRVRYIRTGP